jgi:nucleoside-diphosphate-sugar epimerase
VLVTGGAGFIGSHLVEKLVELGEEVVVLDNLSTGKIENLSSVEDKINFIEGDVRSENDLDKALEGVDYVFHEAALISLPESLKFPEKYNDVNVNGTFKLLMKAEEKGVKRVIFASSSAIYGESRSFPQSEDDKTSPVSVYAINKLVGEEYCKLFSECFDLECVCLRYFNVFGPRQSLDSEYAGVIAKFVSLFLKGERPVVFGDGLQSRDFVFVDDVVKANVSAMKAEDISGWVINIASGKSLSILGVIDSLNEIFGKKIEPKFEEKRRGDVRESVADVKKLREKLRVNGFVSFKEGLKKTIEWFKSSS